MDSLIRSPAVAEAFDFAGLCRSSAELSPMPKLAVEGARHIVRYLNSAFSRLVGKDRSELIGRPFAEAVPEGIENGCLSLLDRVYRTGTTGCLDEQEHQQVPSRHWSYVVWAIPGTDNAPVGLMIEVVDSTESALFRRQVMGMNEKLLIASVRQHELAAEAASLNDQLQVAMEHKNRFMAVLSHELRSPLSPITSAVWLLKQGTYPDPSTREYLDMIERNVALEVRLIEDLLDMTRIDQGKMIVDLRPADLSQVLAHALEVSEPAAVARNLAIEVDLEAGPVLVHADSMRLQQVFWNLLSNAIKFSPDGGHVRIRSHRRDASTAVIDVSDCGVGIEEAMLPHVFDAFQQGDREQVLRFGGLGLGLAICKTIVDLHGGTLRAHSPGKDQGAVFTVTLPILGNGDAGK